MSNMSIKSFREETNQLYQVYDSNFAGRPRATRDLPLLESIISQLEELIQSASSNEQVRNTPSFVDLLQTATDNLNLYKEERVRIKEEQGNPCSLEKAKLDTKNTQLSFVYGRKFAGQGRSTRDLLLLKDLIVKNEELLAGYKALEGKEGAPEELPQAIQDVKDNIELYTSEMERIRQARKDTEPMEQKVSLYATLANEQFQIYTDLFVGKSRVTRRPALLARVIENLEDYLKEMRAIQESPSFSSPTNTNNISIVTSNLALYKEELSQIRSARASTSPAELADQLAVAANDLMAVYGSDFAGQMRATRDLKKLGVLCDAMWEVAQQMESLLDNEVLQYNADNLHKVDERWISYEREYLAVKDAIEANNG